MIACYKSFFCFELNFLSVAAGTNFVEIHAIFKGYVVHTRTELSSRDKRTTFTNGPTLITSKNILQERAQFGNFLKSSLVHLYSADFSTFEIKSFSNLYHTSSPIRIKLFSSHCTIVSVLSIISYDVLFHFFKHEIIACKAQLYEDH